MLIKQYILPGIFVFLVNTNVTFAQNQDQEWTKEYDDPVELAKEVIKKTGPFWHNLSYGILKAKYMLGASPFLEVSIYYFLESPDLMKEFYEGGYLKCALKISEDMLIPLFEHLIQTPKQACKRIAKETMRIGMTDYKNAFKIAKKYIKTGNLNREDAIKFLEYRWGLLKLAQADALYDESHSYNMDKIVAKKTLKALTNSQDYLNFESNVKKGKTKSNKDIAELAFLFAGIFNALEEKNVGLANYEPYINFRNRMDYLNKLKIDEQNRFKPEILVLSPGFMDQWDIANKNFQVKWDSEDYSDSELMKIMLFAGNMQLLEMIAENSGSYNFPNLPPDIVLGDNFQIKISPLMDSFNNQTLGVSGTFSIINSISSAATNISIRKTFVGRKINYISDFIVSSPFLTIYAYDHGRQDGDIISIYLNGEAVLQNHYLTNHKQYIQIKLKEDQTNDLLLYAHNVGDIPPNTVSLILSSSGADKHITLNSNMSSCEGVLIKVK